MAEEELDPLAGSEEEGSQEAEELEEWQPVVSSMISEVRYAEGVIGVVFLSGSEAEYPASPEAFQELLDASSPGRWLWENFGSELRRGG